MNIPTNPTSAGQAVNGKVSWFGGPHDAETGNSKTASGASTSEPGIAIYNRATLGGYWKVTANNGKTAVLKQTDLGPAPFTGRAIDVTYSALGKFGYNEGNFPTDSQFKAVYLGHNPGASVQEAPASTAPTQASSKVTLPGTPAKTETSFNEAAYRKASSGATIGKLFTPAERENNPLFSTGILSTTEPSKAEYTTSKTIPGAPPITRPAASGVSAPTPAAAGSAASTAGLTFPKAAPPPGQVRVPAALPPAVSQAKTALERASKHPVSLKEVEKEVAAGIKGHYAKTIPPAPRSATATPPARATKPGPFGQITKQKEPYPFPALKKGS
jgi:hypothetical protein